jgi:iron complex transport system substrate-binding protein
VHEGPGVVHHPCVRRVGRACCTVIALVALVFCVALPVGSQTPAVAARIVSTSPSITETLFALGLGGRVVGVSTFCRFPPEVVRLPKVGTFLKPDAETIASLKPDLVFVSAGPNAVAAQLGVLGLRASVVDVSSLPTVFSAIRRIATESGIPRRGDELVASIRADLDRIERAVARRPPRKVLIIVGRRTGTLTDIVAVGPTSYLSDIATIAGGTNVLSTVAVEYPRVSMESIIALAPDVIVDVGEMGESPADSARRQQTTERLWKAQTLVKAVREHAVHAINDDAFVVPGPRIVDVARTMAAWFHGVTVR